MTAPVNAWGPEVDGWDEMLARLGVEWPPAPPTEAEMDTWVAARAEARRADGLTVHERHTRAVTAGLLQIAVPVHAEHLATLRPAQVEFRRSVIASLLQGGRLVGAGEALVGYVPGTVGNAGTAFDLLAEGLAILALWCPGGIDYFGLHFEYPGGVVA